MERLLIELEFEVVRLSLLTRRAKKMAADARRGAVKSEKKHEKITKKRSK